VTKYVGEKLFSWTKPAHVEFFSSNVNVQGHILSTGGDVLRGLFDSNLDENNTLLKVLFIYYFVKLHDFIGYFIIHV
jgi:hypothetical protein